MYKRRERIGQGWLGTLYSGEDASGRSVRLIPLQKCTTSWLDEVRERHKLMSSRLVHRALPSLGIHSIGGEPYWVGGWRNGVNLAVAMVQYKIPYPVMTAIAQQIIAILLQARTVGIVHGDLHPQAVWLTANGEVWLDGFGQILGKSEVETRTSASHYTSPSGKPTSSGDVYSLGIILLEAFLDGEVFESGLDEDEHQEMFRDLGQRLKERKLPKGLIQLLVKMVSFSENARITQEKLSKKLDNKTPELVVHSWLQAKYPNIYTSGAPEQKIAHGAEQEDKRVVVNEVDEFDSFSKDIGSLDLLFQNVAILPSYDESYANEQSNDIIEFEKTQNIPSDDLDELTFEFEEHTVIEESSSDEEHTEMLGERDLETDDDPLKEEEEESSFEEHTQAVQLFDEDEDDETAEDFFSAEVTQQLFTDETQEIIWDDAPEEQKGMVQYIAFGIIVISLVFMGIYSDQLFNSSLENGELEERVDELFEPKNPNLADTNPEEANEEDTAEDMEVVEKGKEDKELIENTGNLNTESQKIVTSQKTQKRVIKSRPVKKRNVVSNSIAKNTKKQVSQEKPSKTAVVKETKPKKEVQTIAMAVEDAEEIVWGTSDDDKSLWKQKRDSVDEGTRAKKVVKEEPKIETGMVQLVGDVNDVTLIRNGRSHSVGQLEAGAYQVRVGFPGLSPTVVGTLKLESGKTITIACNSGFASCQIN